MATMQRNLFTGQAEPTDVVQAITDVLERFPETRDNHRLVMLYTWMEHYGLDGVLPVEYHEAFETWFLKAPSPKTISNRTHELQLRYRPDLDASPEVRAQRTKQQRQGVVR